MRDWGQLRVLAGLLLSLALVARAFPGDAAVGRGVLRTPARDRKLCLTYKIQAGIEGEIYPVFANYASLQRQSDRTFGVVSVTISNPGGTSMHRRVSVHVPGWSDEEIQTADLAPGSVRILVFSPAFLPRLYQNREIVAATAHVSITDTSTGKTYECTVPVRLRSAEDIFWGNGFK